MSDLGAADELSGKSSSRYTLGMKRNVLLCAASAVLATALATVAFAQTPQPFPRPGASTPPAPAAPGQPPPATAGVPAAQGAPTEAALGFPIYPAAQFIESFDAGRSQRYYIFGSAASYADLVIYYRKVLRERGSEVFEQPPTHMFEIGRFRDETMAFPPGVTIKDWTWGGSGGYPNPRRGGQPARFPTIIMIVPAPPAPARN